MLLLTFKNWFGPSRKTHPVRTDFKNFYPDHPIIEPETRTEAFVTMLPLGEALDRVYLYETLFKEHSLYTASEYSLIGVTSIENLTEDQIYHAKLRIVEELPQHLSDFE